MQRVEHVIQVFAAPREMNNIINIIERLIYIDENLDGEVLNVTHVVALLCGCVCVAAYLRKESLFARDAIGSNVVFLCLPPTAPTRCSELAQRTILGG